MLPQKFSAATTLGRPPDAALPTLVQPARGTTSAKIAMAIACLAAHDMPPRPFRDHLRRWLADDNGSGSHRQTRRSPRLPGGGLSAHRTDGGHPPGGARYSVTPPMVMPYAPRRAKRSSHARGAGARRITVATSCCCRYRRNREIGGVLTS